MNLSLLICFIIPRSGKVMIWSLLIKTKIINPITPFTDIIPHSLVLLPFHWRGCELTWYSKPDIIIIIFFGSIIFLLLWMEEKWKNFRSPLNNIYCNFTWFKNVIFWTPIIIILIDPIEAKWCTGTIAQSAIYHWDPMVTHSNLD